MSSTYTAELVGKSKEVSRRVKHMDVGIEKGQYGKYVKDSKKDTIYFFPMGEAVKVLSVKTSLDCGKQRLVLEVFDACRNIKKVEIPREDLNELNILKLASYGVQVNKKSAEVLLKCIENQELDAEKTFYHEKLGFSDFQNQKIFKGFSTIGVESLYIGKKAIEPKGDFEVWKKMIQDCVIGNTPMETMLAVGASAVVMDYISNYKEIDNLIVHCVSESSTGKTTAGQLAVSCGGSPKMDGSGLVCSFADTQNSIIAGMVSSFPVLIDEGSMCNYDPTKLLYNISWGKEKNRLTKDHSFAETAIFKTTVIITSEKSLLAMSKENTGLLVRNIMLQGVQFTRSAEESERIKETVEQNYGFLIPMLAKVLLKYDVEGRKEEILQRWEKYKNQIVENAKKNNAYNGLTARGSGQAAILLLTASLVREELGIPLNIDKIAQLLDEQSIIKDEEAVDIGKRALEYLKQWVQVNTSKFGLESEYDNIRDRWGIIMDCPRTEIGNGKFARKLLKITDIAFEKCLEEGGFPDRKVVLKRLKETGYLKCEKDRYVSNFTIEARIPALRGYIILFEEGDEVIPCRIADSTNMEGAFAKKKPKVNPGAV